MIKYFIKLFLIYSAAHFGILFISNGVFWDDWTIFNNDPETILITFSDAGSFMNISGYIHSLLLNIGISSYKFFTFLLMFLSGFYLFLILKRQSWLNEQYCFFITAIFLVFPLYFARVTLICFPYTLSYFLFFLAWYLLPRNSLLSICFFFLSFNTQSLLVFYALPLSEFFISKKVNLFNIKSVLKWFIHNLHFILTPIFFWLIKLLYFKPKGLYQGYNEQFSLSNLIYSPKYMLCDLLKFNISGTQFILFAFVVITSLIFILFSNNWQSIYEKKNQFSFRMHLFYTGFFSFLVAVIPYWILGYAPTFHEWSTRHQLLMPLSAAFILTWVISISNKLNIEILFYFVIVFSITVNINVYRDFYNDIKKQNTLIDFLRGHPEIRKADILVIEDETPKALQRKYRFYELNGIVNSATGMHSLFVLPENEDIKMYNKGYYDRMFTKIYHSSQHVRKDKPVIKVLLIKYDKIKYFLPNTYRIVES
jgi:hypothetical protein